MAVTTQDNLYLSVTTPLGKDKLILTGFRGEERISGLFQYSLELLSQDNNIDFNKIVGKSITVSVELDNGDTRYLNGLVGRFLQAGSDAAGTTYFAEVYPWLWLLTMTSRCRIFQNKTVPEIIEAVFKDFGKGLSIVEYKTQLEGKYEKREYCVQYRESDYDFVSRLMEDEGIFYFFEHEQNKHQLVLADSEKAHADCRGLKEARCVQADASWMLESSITHCVKSQQVTPEGYSMDDFNFETPATELAAKVPGKERPLFSGKLGLYEYPGGFTKKEAAQRKTKLRLESHEVPRTVLRGEGHCRAFVTGSKFKLGGHERNDVNGTYVLQSLVHSATQDGYSNHFEAFPEGIPFRPAVAAKKPVVMGAQTAIVVGKKGEEIWPDKYGRVKVQFHWDQEGKQDENSSCWIRVAQGWAGKQWGSMFLPRVGQEVIVSFLEGDPDRPLITGGVYNGQQTVPYALPGNQTKSTIKSSSSKGGAGYNEIAFEDKKDSEEISVHAQKDMTINVLNDETRTIKQNRTATIQEKDDTLIVEKGNRAIKVSKGNETHGVKGKRSLTVEGDETHTNKAKFTQDVKGNYSLTINGNLTIDVKGSVTIKAGKSLTNQAGTALTNKSGTALTNKAGTSLTNNAGTSLTNQASLSMTNKASASQTVDGGGMLNIKGGMVKIN